VLPPLICFKKNNYYLLLVGKFNLIILKNKKKDNAIYKTILLIFCVFLSFCIILFRRFERDMFVKEQIITANHPAFCMVSLHY
jgi:hypothetical protein